MRRFTASTVLLGLLLGGLPMPLKAQAPDAAQALSAIRATLVNLGTGAEIDSISVVESYALAEWSAYGSVGQAVLEQVGDDWVIIASSQGIYDLDTLTQEGIPSDTATQLINRLNTLRR